MDFGAHEYSASRIAKKVENTLIPSSRLDLPCKLSHGEPENINFSAVVTNAPETLIEHPKKPKIL